MYHKPISPLQCPLLCPTLWRHSLCDTRLLITFISWHSDWRGKSKTGVLYLKNVNHLYVIHFVFKAFELTASNSSTSGLPGSTGLQTTHSSGRHGSVDTTFNTSLSTAHTPCTSFTSRLSSISARYVENMIMFCHKFNLLSQAESSF